MNYICTWFCADEKGEESLFPQSGKKSSSKAHQDIYWRCIVVFFTTSKRFNKNVRHIFFTNVKSLPTVDGRKMGELLAELDVEIHVTYFEYKTPKGYFGKFQNQFYEFSILQYITETNTYLDDQYLILDSDCVFLRPVNKLFDAASSTGFLSFTDNVAPDYVINGLSRNDLKDIYQNLLGREIFEIPAYHLGEFLLCNVENIKKIFSLFKILWPKLIEFHNAGLPKFNEEAHTLSYLYYVNGLRASYDKTLMKRIWTNPLFYRDVEDSDVNLAIWHLPSEKTFGIQKFYKFIMKSTLGQELEMSDEKYRDLLQKMMGIPHLPISRRINYYFASYYRAMMKRVLNQRLLKRFQLAN